MTARRFHTLASATLSGLLAVICLVLVVNNALDLGSGVRGTVSWPLAIVELVGVACALGLAGIAWSLWRGPRRRLRPARPGSPEAPTGLEGSTGSEGVVGAEAPGATEAPAGASLPDEPVAPDAPAGPDAPGGPDALAEPAAGDAGTAAASRARTAEMARNAVVLGVLYLLFRALFAFQFTATIGTDARATGLRVVELVLLTAIALMLAGVAWWFARISTVGEAYPLRTFPPRH